MSHVELSSPWADLELPTATLIQTWLGRVAADPEAPAFHTDATGWVSHGRLAADSARIAARLYGDGLRPGDRVLFSCATSYDLVAAHVAALRVGLVVVPANPAFPEPELAHIATDAEVAAVVIDDDARAGWVNAVVPGVRRYDPATLGTTGPADAPEVAVAPADLAMICYTSGTTGRPKGAALSHGNIAASSWSVAQAWGWTETDRLILCLPLFHVHGLGVGVHGVLHTGGSAILQAGFSVDGVLDAVERHAATMFFGVPTMYERLLRAEAPGQSDPLERLGPLRLCVSGSAPLSAATWTALRDRAGQEVLERYGMSETLMLVSNPGVGERRPGSVGLPLPGVRARIEAAAGAVGEIQVRGGSVFDGYWRRPDATAESFTDDGWFRTGDLGTTDPAGYLRIVGRSKELIISGGFNVYPREVEDVLHEHPSVAEVAVAGVPSAEWGETVAAYIVLAPGAELDEGALAAFTRERLAPYKCPRVWTAVEALPRNALGKVVKARLSPS